MECLLWSKNISGFWYEESIAQAAFVGNFDLVKFLHEHKCPWDSTTTAAAAAGGHIEILEYLTSNKMRPFNEFTWDFAAKNGYFHVVAWAAEKHFCSKATSFFAVRQRILIQWMECLVPVATVWLKNKGESERTKRILEWVDKEISPLVDCYAPVYAYCIFHNYLDVLKYFYNKNPFIPDEAMEIAAFYDRYEILQWLYENNAPWNFKTFEMALRGNSDRIISFLYEAGCPWDSSACKVAVHTGKLNWVRERGFQWDAQSFRKAIDESYDDVEKLDIIVRSDPQWAYTPETISMILESFLIKKNSMGWRRSLIYLWKLYKKIESYKP